MPRPYRPRTATLTFSVHPDVKAHLDRYADRIPRVTPAGVARAALLRGLAALTDAEVTRLYNADPEFPGGAAPEPSPTFVPIAKLAPAFSPSKPMRPTDVDTIMRPST